MIPIKNLYYLLLYAWDKLEEAELVDVDLQPSTDLVNLFGQALAGATQHLLSKGLDRGYVLHAEDVAGVKGRLNVGVSVKRQLFSNARAHCEFDELSYDVLQNQIIKAAMRLTLKAEGLDSGLRSQLAQLLRRLSAVTDIYLSQQAFGRVQLHRNNLSYGFAIWVARMLWENMLIDERSGRGVFRDFVRDEHRMRRMFQAFVFRFYKRHRPDLNVFAPTFGWRGQEESESDLSYLPRMETDVVLQSDDRALIVDTKFTQRSLQERFGRETLRSGHLYQMYAYAKNAPLQGAVEALLIYPAVRQSVRLSFQIDRIPIRVATIDLNREWSDLHKELLELAA